VISIISDYTFYDAHEATMSSYSVKPAVFDLVLTIAISAYVGILYLVLSKWSSIYSVLSSVAINPNKLVKSEINGNSKLKSH
jgi:hypothetical protein